MEEWEVFPTKSDTHGIVHYQDEPLLVLDAPDSQGTVQYQDEHYPVLDSPESNDMVNYQDEPFPISDTSDSHGIVHYQDGLYPCLEATDSHVRVHYQDEPYPVLEVLPRPDTPVVIQENSGQEVQRISVITNLPDLLQDNHADCMRRVVPKVREVLHVAQTEMQLAASSAFLQILQRELVPIHNYASTFLQTILGSVDSKDPDVAAAWLDTLLDVIDLLPKDVIKSDVLTIAVAKGQLSQSVQARLSCCKILGKIATKFEPFIIKKEILPVVQSLCQDVDYEVRGCMCQQLDPVARGLGLEATKSAILPELVELTNDEESYVRITGLETVVSILSLLDDDTCITTIIPLVTKFCQQAMLAEDSTLPVVARQLGRLCHGLSVNLSEDQKHWFVDYFRKMCRVGLSEKNKGSKDADKESPSKQMAIPDLFAEEDQFLECRKNCAYNFPAMVLFVGPRSFKSELFSTFSGLCKDPHILVRRTTASGFHEVSKQLGSCVHLIQGDLMNLLKDDSIEVLQAIIAHLPETLEVLAKGGGGTITEAKMNSLSDVVPALLAADNVIFSSNNWRAQEELMSTLSCLPKSCSSDAISNKVIPVLFQKLFTARAIPVRHAAARTLLVLLRYLKKQEQREELIAHIIEDFCHGRSCHHRSLFIDICRFVMELYSKAFFKEHFFENVLELTSDPVANIRLRLCTVLPLLKQLIKLPYDRNLLQQLEASVRRILINEKDRDVISAIKQAVEELDRIHVQMESLLSRRKNFEDDIEDQLKEEHEKQLLEQEEKERKEEEAKAAKGEKRNAAKQKDNGSSKIPGPKGKGGKTAKDVKEIKRTPSTSSSSNTSMSTSKDVKGRVSTVRNSHLVKSKSTTSIPSLSQIPRRDLQPSRIPLKPKNDGLPVGSSMNRVTPSSSSGNVSSGGIGGANKDSKLGGSPKKELMCKIPVYCSGQSGAGGGSGSSKTTKPAATAVRSGNLAAPSSAGVRKSSVGSLPVSGVTARRGSLNSANSTASDSKLTVKPRTGSGTNGLAAGSKKTTK
ncbi:serine/threonine-protein phosphatase 4 regulatory subunit 4-like [Haliotis asinina]|uniref:serine/threonine-protein phosphatase 4 regulatory subunit 4-like n=1 Tax=Haliotis asinina TaxID=109174 RepID=UPI00353206A5